MNTKKFIIAACVAVIIAGQAQANIFTRMRQSATRIGSNIGKFLVPRTVYTYPLATPYTYAEMPVAISKVGIFGAEYTKYSAANLYGGRYPESTTTYNFRPLLCLVGTLATLTGTAYYVGKKSVKKQQPTQPIASK